MPQSFITIRVRLIKPDSGDAQYVHLEHVVFHLAQCDRRKIAGLAWNWSAQFNAAVYQTGWCRV